MPKRETGTLADLTPDPANARHHTERNIALAEKSLEQYGAARSIVVDESYKLLAGHGIVEAAANVGIEKVRFVEADGNEIVAVVRRGLSKKQKKGLALADNRVGELSEWDPEAVLALADDINLGEFFFEGELHELEAMVDAANVEGGIESAGLKKLKQAADKSFLKLVVAVAGHQVIEGAIGMMQDRYQLSRAEAFVRICEIATKAAGQYDRGQQDSAKARRSKPAV